VGTRFAQDRAAALPLPNHPFDPCIVQAGQVDKYQTVRFDQNSYSVPRPFAFRAVSVKGYVDAVEVVADGAVVARHLRCYDKGQRVLNPLHFLTVLGRKPAALDHAPVYRDWKLPATFADLRRDLEAAHGAAAGTRQFIRVLQQLNCHPIERIERAVAACRARQRFDAAAIIARLDVLAEIETTPPTLPNGATTDRTLAAVTVPPPDLQRFNALLSPLPHGDSTHVDANQPVAQDQPQTVETADHAVGV
jgi:hypothetical protein